MEDELVIVMITVPNKDIGKQIAYTLVSKKLAACVNMVGPIASIYSWNEAINEDSEYLLLCKTRLALVENDLVAEIQLIHPYDLPEIIALPIRAGSKEYLDWVKLSTLDKDYQ